MEMKLFIIFVVVICYFSHGKSIDATKDSDNRLKLDDLNSDVLLEMLDNVEFENLFDLADVNQEFRNLISHYYLIQKYHFNKQFVPIIYRPYNYKIQFIEDYDGIVSLYIYQPKHVLRFLRIFGHLISPISIDDTNLPMKWRHRISSYINEYCSESLEELRVPHFEDELLLEWKKPFKNVSIVSFERGKWNCEKININISEIFPVMLSFDTKEFKFSSSKCIDYHLPHLEHIQFPMYTQYSKNIMYGNIFDLNPQLRSIHIRDMDNFDILRVANQKLHHLEAIELTYLDSSIYFKYDSETIRFKYVKRFEVQTRSYQHIDARFIPLKFDQLEEMRIDSEYPITENWIAFISEQQKLKILSLFWIYREMDSHILMLIIDNLPELKVIKARWTEKDGRGGIAQVMRRQTKLEKIVLTRLSRREYNIFRNLIGHQWQLDGEVQEVMKGITFIRSKINV